MAWHDVFCTVSFSAPLAWGASVTAGAGVLCRGGGESHGQEESAGQGLAAIISCFSHEYDQCWGCLFICIFMLCF